MAATTKLAYETDAVKSVLHDIIDNLVGPLLERAWVGDLGLLEAERETWAVLLELGRVLLGALFGMLCRRQTESALAARGRSVADAYLRMDKSQWATVRTTLGEVTFPWFSFREKRGGMTKNPARAALFPRYKRCNSSRLLLEWECVLASDHPFRAAQRAMTFYTHGAVKMEDTTIARHAVAVGGAISRTWLFRDPTEISEILRDRAVRDEKTGLPLVYASTDAHMLCRYVDDTWDAAWKAINGIRVWCVDSETKQIIHLGGVYTWGDCEEVTRIFEDFDDRGVLPRDGVYPGGLKAQIVLVTDGARWIEERILPLYPGAIAVLDAYHVLERIGKAAAKVFRKGSRRLKAFLAKCATTLGLRAPSSKRSLPRKGHRKGAAKPSAPPVTGSVDDLFLFLLAEIPENKRAHSAVEDLAEFLDNNAYRMHYADLRNRGIQIGSGAMESLHRFGSQLRLKRSGCRWLAETALAILNLRLLHAVERWDEYWAQPDLEDQIAGTAAA